MKTFFDSQIRPLSKSLDKKLGIKHITVQFDEPDPWDLWAEYIPVVINYKLPNGKKRLMTAHYIREMKYLGVLPR